MAEQTCVVVCELLSIKLLIYRFFTPLILVDISPVVLLLLLVEKEKGVDKKSVSSESTRYVAEESFSD